MNNTFKLVLTVAVVIAIAGLFLPVGNTVIERVLGSNAGPDHYDLQSFQGGLVERNYFATSTTATTQTFAARDIAPGGALYSTLAVTPNTGDITITLPASSTMSSVLPVAGMSATQCWYNASTTAGIDITIAAGTGIDLEVASSTITDGAPALTVLSDNSGCFRWTRKAATASAFDFSVLFTRFVNGD